MYIIIQMKLPFVGWHMTNTNVCLCVYRMQFMAYSMFPFYANYEPVIFAFTLDKKIKTYS